MTDLANDVFLVFRVTLCQYLFKETVKIDMHGLSIRLIEQDILAMPIS